jgi:hypothetical protein
MAGARVGLVVAILFLPHWALAGIDEELAAAAKSPYDVARFVDTHITFEWNPLWRALGIQHPDPVMNPCGEMGGPRRDCEEELVTVLDPFQVIVILRHSLAMPEVFLRFRRQSGPEGNGAWKFAGCYNPIARYFDLRHRTLRMGGKPFLVVTRQGATGSDWSSEVDDWMDLTLTKFEPVLSLTRKGHYSGMPDRVGLETSADVVLIESGPAERIHVAYHVRFDHAGEELGERWDNVVYVRRGQEFVFDPSLSGSKESDIENLYNIGMDGPSNDDYLRYLLPELKKIAAGPRSEKKDWLERFLKECHNTAEKRQIQAVLAK